MIPHHLIQRELGLRGSFYDYVKMAWPQVVHNDYHDGWHIKLICDHLQAVAEGQIRNLIINVPPGSMKTLNTSVFFNSWAWLHYPSLAFIYASYDLSNMLRASEMLEDLLISDWYKTRWGDHCSLDPQAAKREFTTDQGGYRYNTSVQGPLTGRHADILIVDDPMKPLAANSAYVGLDLVINWWRGTVTSRMKSDETGRKIVIMQRLHEDDLTGYLLRSAPEEWTHLSIPMRFEQSTAYKSKWGNDPRNTEGEVMWPEHLSDETLRKKERDMGAMVVASQLQQRPAPEGGAIFKAQQFKYWSVLPAKFDFVVCSWDCSFKDTDGSDYVAGQVWGKKGGEFYLIDSLRKRMGYSETQVAVETFTRKYPYSHTLIEDTANGVAVIDSLKKKLSGIIPVKPQGGKLSRAHAVTPLFEAGNVYFPDPTKMPWVNDLIGELLQFPVGSNDDQVDSLSQALTYLQSKVSHFGAAMEAAQRTGNW